MRTIILLIILILLVNDLNAAKIKGKVNDSKTGEPLIGATVQIRELNNGAVTDRKGKYKIKGIETGHFILIAKFIGYKTESKQISISGKEDELTYDFSLDEERITTANVIVEGRVSKELEMSARLSEKSANNVINVITAEAIEHSTDVTSADVLQRVSGLSLVRSQGEGKYVIMRGLEQRFNNTLVNGVKIPSPESKDRFVPLDIFPSQLMQKIEVTKSLTPDMEGDAIGGTTNLVLREAPENPILNFNAATGYSSTLIDSKFSTFNTSSINNLDPDRIHGVVSDANPTQLLSSRVNVNKNDFSWDNLKFQNIQAPPEANISLILGRRFLDQKFGLIISGTYQNTYSNYESNYYGLNESVTNIGVPYLSTLQNRNYSTNKTRYGISSKLDYIIDKENEINFTFLYVNQQVLEARHTLQTQIDGGRGDADLNYQDRTSEKIQNIANYQLDGSHKITKEISLKWTANYSDAIQDRPDEAQIAVTQNYDQYMQLEPNQWLKSISRIWRKNDDQQLLGKLDFTYNPEVLKSLTIKAGSLVQKLSRVNYENGYSLMPIMPDGRSQVWKGVDSIAINPYSNAAGSPVYGFQNYKANETIISGYIQGLYEIGELQILGGVRIENTSDDYFTMAPSTLGGNKAVIKYTDILPSIHFRYLIEDDRILRLSLGRTLSRPSYFDLVPAIDVQEELSVTGNPNLKASHSLNLDARYEYYLNNTGQLTGGLYFKNIYDDIEQTFIQNGNNLILTNVNAGTATIYGFEIVFSKRFGNFGFVGNYCYAQTSITTLKQTPKKGDDDLPIYPAPTYMQTRPMQGQSNHIANLSLIYNNEKSGTVINLAYNFTGRKLDKVNYRDGFDEYLRDIHSLDLSAEQYLLANFKINLKLQNILSLPIELEVPSGDVINHSTLIIRKEYSKLKGSIGIAFKL